MVADRPWIKHQSGGFPFRVIECSEIGEPRGHGLRIGLAGEICFGASVAKINVFHRERV